MANNPLINRLTSLESRVNKSDGALYGDPQTSEPGLIKRVIRIEWGTRAILLLLTGQYAPQAAPFLNQAAKGLASGVIRFIN